MGSNSSFCNEPNGKSCSNGKTLSVSGKASLSVEFWQRAEIGVLCLVVVILWGLLSLPVVFYHLPSGDDESGSTESRQGLTCTPDIYTGDVCRSELQSQQDCLPDRLGSSDIHISPRDGEDQEELEIQAKLLLNGLSSPLISASPECEEAVLPFLCLYLFSLCDSNGTLYQPSSMDCVTISTVVCAREWIIATNFLGQEALPQCELLPVATIECENIVSDDVNVSNTTDSSNFTSDSCSVECQDGFYINTTLCACLPRCDTWRLYSHTTTVVTDVFTLLAACIGFIAGVAVIVISCIRRKRMFVFPSVFVVYSTTTLVVFIIFLLISYTDRSEFYCTSMDLQESVENTSAFCSVAGALFYYTLLQLALWWFFHVSSVFWTIKFPFHAKAAESAHHTKYIHITMVLLALLLPLVPVIAAFATTGFVVSRFPAILCLGSNANAVFYSLVLPLILLLTVGMTLLIVLFWTIHKQHGLFRIRLSKSPFKIDTAERKILIIFCYYALLGVIALITFTLVTRDDGRLLEEITGYFRCEFTGIDPQSPCDRSRYQALLNPELNCISYVLLGIFPVVNLVFAVNVEELKQGCGCALCFRTRLTSTSGEPPSTSSTNTSASATVIAS